MEWWIPEIFALAKTIIWVIVAVWGVQKILNEYLNFSLRHQQQQLTADRVKMFATAKLQAYERLTLFLDRISIPSLIVRLQSEQMDSSSLSAAMLISIQKEFEHNITQQLYVKENLWNIIQVIKDEISAVISLQEEKSTTGSAKEFIRQMMKYHQEQGQILIKKGHQAIREESLLLLHS